MHLSAHLPRVIIILILCLESDERTNSKHWSGLVIVGLIETGYCRTVIREVERCRSAVSTECKVEWVSFGFVTICTYCVNLSCRQVITNLAVCQVQVSIGQLVAKSQFCCGINLGVWLNSYAMLVRLVAVYF